jgi:crotonobetainyl-CoA:carnitine CoA-transferase CaiB-like acyl-CoA transferase
MAIPSRWSAGTPADGRPAPRLGEHSTEVLREAGYADAEIEAMIAARVTKTPSSGSVSDQASQVRRRG